MDQELANAVRRRARDTYEYRLLPQTVRRLRFQIEHIIARQHGGESTIENLALACGRCSRHKGTNIAGIDPASRQMTRLFNPRMDRWSDHFRWEGPRAVGLTAIGRATVEVLEINHPDEIAIRLELEACKRFPPIPPD